MLLLDVVSEELMKVLVYKPMGRVIGNLLKPLKDLLVLLAESLVSQVLEPEEHLGVLNFLFLLSNVVRVFED